MFYQNGIFKYKSTTNLLPPVCGGAWLNVARKAASRASRAALSPLSESRRTYYGNIK